jgi:energy-coupling factor transporter ATP-binding protein EcfA2
MPALEITVQHAQPAPEEASPIWPATLELRLPHQLPRRVSAALQTGETWLADLHAQSTPEAYGRLLGEALFHGRLRDLFLSARTAAGDRPLHMLLVVEDPELQGLQWEWLAVPREDGTWDPLAHQQQLPLTRSLPSASGRSFAPLSRHDLRALIVLANPPENNRHGASRFDEQAVCEALHSALGDIPCDILGTIDDAVAKPTLANLRTRLTVERYALLHIVAHGTFSRQKEQTALYLLGEEGALDRVEDTRLERELRRLKELPHLIFFTACESAERGRHLPHTGLAQQLVRNVGIPAVVAMTRSVSMTTANELATHFYPPLRRHGSPALALAQARAALYERMDVLVPALYSRLENRPLFDDDDTRPPTPGEIEHGLQRLRTEMARRAPAFQELDREMVDILRGYADPQVRQEDPQKQAAWQAALEQADRLSRGVLEVSFTSLAGDAALPDYDDRCPFPGRRPFEMAEAPFFHGRQELVDQIVGALEAEQRVLVIGPAGSGKSSLLQAGVAARLAESHQLLVTTPDRPLEETVGDVDEPALLLVDQGERLFTRMSDPQRHDYAAALDALPSQVKILFALRESFLHLLDAEPALAPLAGAPQIAVPPLPPETLRDVIERQAAAVSLRFEAEVARTIVDDVAGEPGAMTVMQATLNLLWQERYGTWLRMKDYVRLGGAAEVAVALAEKSLAEMEEERRPIRHLLLRLAHIGDDPARATPRPMPLADLAVGDLDLAATRRLAARLADRGVIVTAEKAERGTAVKIAHEALLRRWPVFQQWARDDAPFLPRWEQLYAAQQRWRSTGHDPSALLRGRMLAEAQSLVEDYGSRLSGAEREFIATSAAAAAAAAARRETAQRNRAALLGFPAGAIGFGLTTYFVSQGAPLDFRLFLMFNQALYGGLAGLMLFLLLDPQLLRALDHARPADWLRAIAVSGGPVALLLAVNRFLTLSTAAVNPSAIILTILTALLTGFLAGGLVGAGIVWRSVREGARWTFIVAGLVAALCLAAGNYLSAQLVGEPVGIVPSLLSGLLLPTALLLAAELNRRSKEKETTE